MITAVKSCFSQYATFSGRASRPEFWYFALFMVIGSVVAGVLDIALFPAMEWSPLGSIFNLVTFLPSIAVAARRLHDIDRSGWWQLINIIPLIGWIIFLVWTTSLGTRGPNRFGDNPMPITVMA
jgi:uncharacterized membrane protein YhaH (DUF805 family)